MLKSPPFKIWGLTTLALLAFAGNSILCRYALKEGAIDAASFSTVRLLAGAIFLFILVSFKNKPQSYLAQGSWTGAIWLFIYAASFSFAYISLDTGIGALILFGAVQVTMILVSLIQGKHLSRFEWMGLITAFGGLLVLLLPGAGAPSLWGFGLMALSGIAWGLYSLSGRGSSDPLLTTAGNFYRTIPLIIVLTMITFNQAHITTEGLVLAIVTGAITSGLGYAIWYAALKNLQISQASIVQLSVPIIAALGGVVISQETISVQLLLSSLLVLGGLILFMLGKKSA